MPSKRHRRFSYHSLVIESQHRKIPCLGQKLWRNMHIMSGGGSPQFWRSSTRSKKCLYSGSAKDRQIILETDSADGYSHENRQHSLHPNATSQHSDTNSSDFERLVSFVDCGTSNSADKHSQEYGGEISDDETSSDEYVIFPQPECNHPGNSPLRKVSVSTIPTTRTYSIEARRPLHKEGASSSKKYYNNHDSPGKYPHAKQRPPQATKTSPRQKIAPYNTDKVSSTECDDDDSVKFVRRIEPPQTSKSSDKGVSSTSQRTEESECSANSSGKYHQHPLLLAHRNKLSSIQLPKDSVRPNFALNASSIKQNKDTRNMPNSIVKIRNNAHMLRQCHNPVLPSGDNLTVSQSNNSQHGNFVENRDEDDMDDDIIVVQTDQVEKQEIDSVTLRRVVISVVGHYLEENPDSKVTMQFILQRLKALYHKDFTERSTEIKYYIRRALQRCHSAQAQKLRRVVRPGVRQADIITLSSENWVNDVIIDQYMAILVKDKPEYGAISSFWYGELLRGTEPILPAEWKKMEYILAPTCLDSHWSLLCYLPSWNCIEIYSSLTVCGTEVQCGERLLDFFHKKSKASCKGDCRTPSGLPHQQNEYDCGVYVCMFARCVVCKNSFDISPRQVCEFRGWLKNEIVQAKLLDGQEEISCNFSDSDSDLDTRSEHNIEYLD